MNLAVACLPDMLTRDYNQYQHIRTQMEKLKNCDPVVKKKRICFKFQLKEIQDINPQPRKTRPLADEKRFSLIFKSYPVGQNLLRFALWWKDSVIVKLKEVQNQVKEIKKIDANLKLADTDIESSFITLRNGLDAAWLWQNLFFDPKRLVRYWWRLELLNRLKRKYSGLLKVFSQEAGNRGRPQSIFCRRRVGKLCKKEEIIKDWFAKNALKLSPN